MLEQLRAQGCHRRALERRRGRVRARRKAELVGIDDLFHAFYDKDERGDDGRYLVAHLAAGAPPSRVRRRPPRGAPADVDAIGVVRTSRTTLTTSASPRCSNDRVDEQGRRRTGAEVEVVDDGPVRRVTLDRPEKRNAMTIAMFDAVTDAVEGAVADDVVRVVVLRGRGDHFCAGAEIGTGDRTDGDEKPAKPRTGHLQRNLRASPHRMIRTLFEAEIPIVTGVQGYAAGIGNALALVGDHVVAARSAQFWVPFVSRGFTPDSGTTFLLPRLIGVARAKEMILRGMRVDGTLAADWGLVSQVVDDGTLDAAVEEVVQEFAHAPTVAVEPGQAARVPRADRRPRRRARARGAHRGARGAQ